MNIRAATHNKGIFNGIDALALATGNDFRAIEAGAHTYACRNGKYQSLTDLTLDGGIFHYELDSAACYGNCRRVDFASSDGQVLPRNAREPKRQGINDDRCISRPV